MAILETERLTLRQLSPDDAAFILELLSEPSFIRYIGDKGVRDLNDARNYILNGPMESYKQHGFGLYLVELKTDDRSVPLARRRTSDARALPTPIGICGVLKRDTLPDPDIGFAFLPAYWKLGYAFESAAATMKYAREVLHLDRILAITSPDNEASEKLLGKIGLRFDRLTCLSEVSPEVKLFTSETRE